MKLIRCFCALIVWLLVASASNEMLLYPPSLSEYLNEKAQLLRDVIQNGVPVVASSNSIRRQQGDANFGMEHWRLHVKIIKSAQINNTANYANLVHTFQLFEQTFVLHSNGTLFRLADHKDALIALVGPMPNASNVSFVRAITYHNIGLMVVGEPEALKVYVLDEYKLYLLQTIRCNNVSDAHMFTLSDQLYLIVATDAQLMRSFITVYIFLETYFDTLQEIETRAAKRIATMRQNDDGQLIFIGQALDDGQRITSTLYRFEAATANLVRLQQFDFHAPTNAVLFADANGSYMLISKHKEQALLKWNGYNFMEINTFRTDIDPVNIIVFSNATLGMFGKDGVQFYGISKNGRAVQQISDILLINHTHADMSGKKIVVQAMSNSQFLVLLPTNAGNGLRIVFYNMSMEFVKRDNVAVQRPSNDAVLLDCFLTLEQDLYRYRRRFGSMRRLQNNDTIPQNQEQNDDTVPLQHTASKRIPATSPNPMVEIKKQLLSANQKLNQLHHLLDANNDTKLIFKDPVVLKAIHAERLISNSTLHVSTINSVKWNPDDWLRYREDQIVTGPVAFEAAEVERLAIPEPEFQDLVRVTDENVTLSGAVVVAGNVHVRELYATTLNNLSISDDLYRQSVGGAIRGEKTVRVLRGNVSTMQIVNQFRLPEHNFTFSDNVHIEELIVDRIDGVDWDAFRQSVFLIGITHNISGNINVEELRVNELHANTLFGRQANRLLTRTTEQHINSSIWFNGVFAREVTASVVNGVKHFENVVATTERQHVPIKGSVSIDSAKVEDDMKILNAMNNSMLLFNHQHIVGTQASDLLQLYKGRVTINGDLIVSNLQTQSNDTKIRINGKPFDANVRLQFWTRNTVQNIPVRVVAGNGLSCVDLHTNHVNGIPLNSFLMNIREQGTKLPASYYFDNVTIFGNVEINETQRRRPDLPTLRRDAVQLSGSFIIDGYKHFEGSIKVDDMTVHRINDIELATIPKITSKGMNFTGDSVIDKLLVAGDVTVSNNATVQMLNDVNLEQLLQSTLYMNQTENIVLAKVSAQNITVRHLSIKEQLNEISLTHIAQLQQMNESFVIDQLHLHGDATIDSCHDVKSVNNVSDFLWEQHKQMGSRFRNDSAIYGPVRLKGNITFGALYVSVINKVIFPQLCSRLLYKNVRQIIQQPYTFTNLKSDNVRAPRINGKPVRPLVSISNKSAQFVDLASNLTIVNANASHFSAKEWPCGLDKAESLLTHPTKSKWNSVRLEGYTNLSDLHSNGTDSLQHIVDTVVSSDSVNIIYEKVSFDGHLFARNAISRALINGINVNALVADAVLSTLDEPRNNDSSKFGAGDDDGLRQLTQQRQHIVGGYKHFYRIETYKIEVTNNVNCSKVNGMDMLRINDSIVAADEVNNGTPIAGRKVFFKGVQADRILTDQLGGVQLKNIVDFTNQTSKINAVFTSFAVDENLNVTFLNKFPLNKMLQRRLLRRSNKTQHVISPMHFSGKLIAHNIVANKINGIAMEDVVYDQHQASVGSMKKFSNDVFVTGQLHADYVNGIPLSETFDNSIVAGENLLTDAALTISAPAVLNGNITAQSINGMSLVKLNGALNRVTKSRVEMYRIEKITEKIENMVEQNMPHMIDIPRQYLYFERSAKLQIPIENGVNAKSMRDQDNSILLHIDDLQTGLHCGLPAYCPCTFQTSLEITPHYSINVLVHNGTQRMFTYNNENVIVQLLTNSISTSGRCRTDRTKVQNEISTLTWNLIPSENRTGQFHMHPQHFVGYISGVEYFSINGYTYVVIGRYYDPVLDSHDLDCTILKLNPNGNAVEEIQKIPTTRGWILTLFTSAQGVVLVLGNGRFTDDSNEFPEKHETMIYRFNVVSESFELLRSVPYPSASAVGVVMPTESFIVLAGHEQAVEVLRYSSQYDNYYLYQSIRLKSSVTALSIFYTGDMTSNDAHICVTTKDNNFFIYAYQFVDGLKLVSNGRLNGITNLIPFYLNDEFYMLALSSKLSSLLLSVVIDVAN